MSRDPLALLLTLRERLALGLVRGPGGYGVMRLLKYLFGGTLAGRA